ncbi:AMP-binding protein [Haliangium sp.]|uniref:AMP-binding protein n=1 Tax=Haliangium sp. TaxID=2663208 RepID=UPI003D0E40C7
MPTPGHNFAGRLLDQALAHGWTDRIALRQGGEAWTYATLAGQVRRVAATLRALRIGRGERVALLMPDSLDAAAAILGVIHAGAVAVPLSELTRPPDMRAYLDHCGASAAIVHHALAPALDTVRGELAELREVLCVGDKVLPGMRDHHEMVAAISPAPAPAAVGPGDPALIVYSIADVEHDLRGVPHNHATPMEAFASFGEAVLGLGPEDRVFSLVRLSTTYGLGLGLFFPLAAGAESLLLAEQPKSHAVFAALQSFAPTVFMSAPSLFRQLVHDAGGAGCVQPLSECRAAISATEGMPPKLTDKIRDVLGVDIMVSFGLTEAFQIVLMGTAEDARQGACGRPVAGFDARVVDDHGQPTGPNAIGTLQIRGPTLLAAYWGGDDEPDVGRASRPPPRMRAPTHEPDWAWHQEQWPGETWPIAHWRDGWFTTRDRFMHDEGGNFYHFGRIDDLFKVGGKWISPTEMERALSAHESVWECAVIGAEDEDGLTKPMAFVVPNVGHPAGSELAWELRDYLKAELAAYKYPRWIEFVEKLPRGPHGKILRYKLHARGKARMQMPKDTAGKTIPPPLGND